MKWRVVAGVLAALVAFGTATAASAPLMAEGNAVSATFGPDGRLWRVVPHKASLDVAWSSDHGATFRTPTVIDARRQRLRVDPEGRPSIVVSGRGRVFVAWTADARKPSRAFVSVLDDKEQSFSAPVPVSGGNDAMQIRGLLALDGQAEPRLFYLDTAGAGGSLMAARVGSGSAPDVIATRLVAGTCECCRLAAARDAGGNLAVLSRMVYPGGIRDFGLIRETTLGNRSATRVTDDDWRIDACPEHGGSLAIGDDGRHHLVWFTQGTRRQGLYYASSDDAGRNWSKALAIGNPDALAGHGDVIVRGRDVFLVWQEFDGNQSSVLAMTSADRGQSWSSPRRLAAARGAADYPFLLADSAGVYVSWYSADDGYRLLPVAAPVEPAAPVVAAPRPFHSGSFNALVAAHTGKSFGVVMWSLDCAPCLREFDVVRALRKEGRLLPLVLVGTDGANRSDEAAELLRRLGLDTLETWNFSGAEPQRLRYEIDPRWYGEMPRTYFYAADGSRTAHSGGLTRQNLATWLDSLTPKSAASGTE